jgi:hypothetical protein
MSKKVSTGRKTKFDDLPDEIIGQHILKYVNASKAMHATTNKYTELLKSNFNNKKWLKDYLAETFSKPCKNIDVYNLQLIPSKQSKLPTIDIIARRYCSGDSILEIKKENEPISIFLKVSPVNNEIKNPKWYDEQETNNKKWWKDTYKNIDNQQIFTDVLANLESVKVPSPQKTDLIKSWNQILTAKSKK